MAWHRLVGRYLRTKIPQIGIFVLIVIIYALDFWLWHLPMMALLNTTLFAFIIFLIYLVSSFFRWKGIQDHLSELTKENEELKQQLDKQILAEKEFTDIIRVWSHQMKIPLSAIDMMTQTQTEIDPEELKNQVFSLENYLNILLEYQRITNLATDFKFEKVSLSALTKDLIRRYSSFFIQKNLSVKIEGDWQLISDKRWLSLAIEQFLSNAVKYTQSGGITIKIEPSQFSLEDTGMGILKEDLPRLFEHGFTGYNGRIQQKSTGLGLYLAKLILDKLEFDIAVSSEVGKGTCVTLRKIK